ncbi:hypothetical protein os4_23290 [Comamonadaceae bacterium OS-4]|nr:hypothetical protein os4_23290 [Comamonadaceae bacterium OS-4]
MKLIISLIVAAFLACVVPVGLWVSNFKHLPLASSSGEWSNFGSYLGGVLSPVLAFLSFIGLLLAFHTQRKEAARLKDEGDDLNYFNHSVKSLERAFEALVTRSSRYNGDNGLPLVQLSTDRLAWLNCARLILSAKAVAKQISQTSAGLLALYEGEEEYWRHQFYELFHEEKTFSMLLQPNFFGNPGILGGAQLEERSIRVIFEFSDWPEDKVDPIDAVPLYSLDELSKMKASMSGVREYVLAKGRFNPKPTESSSAAEALASAGGQAPEIELAPRQRKP